MLADRAEGELVAFTVGTGAVDVRFDVRGFVDENIERCVLPRSRIHAKSVESSHIVSSILREAGDKLAGYDLVVLGCTRQSLASQFMRESVPETVARLCDTPLVMVKAAAGPSSWVKRWL